MRRLLCAAALAVFVCLPAAADTSLVSSSEAEPYRAEEFPQWVLDARRSEIITLGSLPFTLLGVTLVYGSVQYFSKEIDSFPNPFNRSSYSEDEVLKLTGISLGVSAAVGLTDFIISFIERRSSQQRLKRLQEASNHMTPVPLTPEEAGELLRRPERAPAGEEVD